MGAFFATISSGPNVIFPSISYRAIAPEGILVIGALVIMLSTSLIPALKKPRIVGSMGVVVGLVGLGDVLSLWSNFVHHGAFRTVGGSITVDGFAIYLMITIMCGVVLSALAGQAYLSKSGIGIVEFQSLLLLSCTGALLLISAGDLIVIFLGLEILSISLYVLTAFEKRNLTSGEAGIKYYVLGGFSSAIFLYGIALVYGGTGSTNIAKIATYLSTYTLTSNGVLLAGLILIIVGLGFKVAAAPFHVWTPDVYQGAPSAATGFMASVAKAGAFAGLFRILVAGFPMLRFDWTPIVWMLAALSLVVGAVLAVVQSDLKRMLAYSSINHAGFVLLGVVAGTAAGVSAALFYLLAYTFMVIGTFAIVNLFENPDEGTVTIEGLRGLSSTNPAVAFFLAVLLVAQAGAPLTTGLLAKLAVVAAVVKSHSYAIAVIAMLSAVVATFFYLKVVAVVFSKPKLKNVFESQKQTVMSDGSVLVIRDSEPLESVYPRKLKVLPESMIVIGISVGFTVIFGIFPNLLLEMARSATILY